jgi:hypothetical protein
MLDGSHLAYGFRSLVVGNGFVSTFLYNSKLLQVGTRNDVILTHTDRLDNTETNFGLALGCRQHLRNVQHMRSYVPWLHREELSMKRSNECQVKSCIGSTRDTTGDKISSAAGCTYQMDPHNGDGSVEG